MTATHSSVTPTPTASCQHPEPVLREVRMMAPPESAKFLPESPVWIYDCPTCHRVGVVKKGFGRPFRSVWFPPEDPGGWASRPATPAETAEYGDIIKETTR